jgi:prevent-host-death family protein
MRKEEPMIDPSRDIHSLTDFKRKTTEFMKQLKETGSPVVLTVNGKAELIVQDAAAYQKLLELVEQVETIAGIRRGLEEMKAGKGRPASEFFAEMERKYNILPEP